MPKWGLTVEQRSAQPWGLPAEILEPAKTVTDPVHGDIFLTRLEAALVDSAPMQRLRRVRQLGTTHLVYPGASHSRFSHSLGALRAAQDLVDVVVAQRSGPDSVPDIFSAWQAEPDEYDRRVAEVTVLARLGALLHDMCHVPFGHSIEDDLQILVPHDENARRFATLWAQFDAPIQDLLRAGGLESALRPLILSKEDIAHDSEAETRYPFVGDIVGNTICADLIDYLERDHLFTGLPAQLGKRFLSGFYVTRPDHTYFPQRMVMRITRNGREREDVTSELFKYLRYRYELSERALVHHAKLAADAMLGKALEMWTDAVWLRHAAERFPADVKATEKDIDGARSRLAKTSADAIPALDIMTQNELENELLRHGDDGLLEHLLYLSERAALSDARMNAIAELVRGLLNRRLFKLVGTCRNARAIADEIFAKFGSPDKRRQLEREVTDFAGLQHRNVVLWIPQPNMRMKAAGVLVDDGHKLSRLYDLDRTGRHRGDEIYESHAALWGIRVFVDAAIKVDDETRRVVLSKLSTAMNVTWDGWQPETVDEIAGRRVAQVNNVAHRIAERLNAPHAARGGGSTFGDLVREKQSIVDAMAPSGLSDVEPIVSEPSDSDTRPPQSALPFDQSTQPPDPHARTKKSKGR